MALVAAFRHLPIGLLDVVSQLGILLEYVREPHPDATLALTLSAYGVPLVHATTLRDADVVPAVNELAVTATVGAVDEPTRSARDLLGSIDLGRGCVAQGRITPVRTITSRSASSASMLSIE